MKNHLTWLAGRIAELLGEGWSVQEFDEDTSWRVRMTGPNHQRLFISNTWAGRGRIYIGGWIPDFITDTSLSNGLPSITVAETKNPEAVAKDIARRLLPDYQFALSAIIKKHEEQQSYAARMNATKAAVAKIIGGAVREDQDIVYGFGKADVQVCGPDSLRLHGHCFYFTAEQLERIVKAVPELFAKEA